MNIKQPYVHTHTSMGVDSVLFIAFFFFNDMAPRGDTLLFFSLESCRASEEKVYWKQGMQCTKAWLPKALLAKSNRQLPSEKATRVCSV